MLSVLSVLVLHSNSKFNCTFFGAFSLFCRCFVIFWCSYTFCSRFYFFLCNSIVSLFLWSYSLLPKPVFTVHCSEVSTVANNFTLVPWFFDTHMHSHHFTFSLFHTHSNTLTYYMHSLAYTHHLTFKPQSPNF